MNPLSQKIEYTSWFGTKTTVYMDNAKNVKIATRNIFQRIADHLLKRAASSKAITLKKESISDKKMEQAFDKFNQIFLKKTNDLEGEIEKKWVQLKDQKKTNVSKSSKKSVIKDQIDILKNKTKENTYEKVSTLMEKFIAIQNDYKSLEGNADWVKLQSPGKLIQ